MKLINSSLEEQVLRFLTFWWQKVRQKATSRVIKGKAYIIHLRKYVTIFSKSLIRIIFRGKLKQLKNN